MAQPTVSTMGEESQPTNRLERRSFVICAVVATASSLLVGFLFGAVVLPRTYPDERGMGSMEQYMFTRCNGASPCTYTGGGTDFEKACNALGGSTKSALGNDYCFYKGQLTIFTRCNGVSPCTYTGGGTDFEKACNELDGSTNDALGQDYCFLKGELGMISQKSKGTAMLLAELHLEDYTNDAP